MNTVDKEEDKVLTVVRTITKEPRDKELRIMTPNTKLNHRHPPPPTKETTLSIQAPYATMVERIKGRLEESRFQPPDEQFLAAVQYSIFKMYQQVTKKTALEIREEFNLPPGYRDVQRERAIRFRNNVDPSKLSKREIGNIIGELQKMYNNK